MPAWHTALTAAAAAGDPYYLRCTSCGAASLPPRGVCPDCGSTALRIAPLSPRATVTSFTEIHVSTPRFADETPYTVVVAAFDEGVSLTGQLRGATSVEVGDEVELGAEPVDEGERILTFEPA